MKKYIFLATAVVALAACSSNEEIEQIGKCEIKLSSTLEVLTRAAQGIQSTEFDEGESVAVFINENTTAESPSVTYGQPLKYKVGENKSLTTTDPQYFPQNGNGVDIYAVYPYDAGKNVEVTETAAKFAVQDDQSTNDNYKASDLMVGQPQGSVTVYKTTSDVKLVFDHCLSKININITAGDGLTTDDLLGAEVSILGITNSATFNVKTGEVIADKLPTSSSIIAGTLQANNGVIAGISAIIIPQEVTAGSQFISIKIGGDQQTAPTELVYTLPTGAANMDFNPGYSYTFNITAKKSGLTVDGTSINSWKEGSTVAGDAIIVP